MVERGHPSKARSFGVVPAAGHSRRMGSQKLLLPFRGTTVIDHLLSAWQKSRVAETIVVVRANGELEPACRSAGAHIVTPETPPPYMKDSVQAALSFISKQWQPDELSVWLLAPADMPLLSVEAIDALLTAAADHEGQILIPTCGGKRGHPVLIPWSFVPQVFQLADDEGIKALFNRNPVVQVEMGPSAIPQDLDTPEDYQRLQA